MVTLIVETEPCHNCEGLYPEEELLYTGEDLLCRTCLDTVYVNCVSCGDPVHEDKALTVVRDSASYCAGCAKTHRVFDPDRCADA